MTRVLALDLATLTGWAYGSSRSSLKIGTWDCRAEHKWLVPGVLAYKMRMLFKENGPPDFLALEGTIPIPGQKNLTSAESQLLLHGAALGISGFYRIPKVLEVAPATIRKHFCGQANAGSRNETKGMVIRRCHQLGYKAEDDNQADAVALYDYVVHVVLRKPLKEVRMFRP